MYLSLDSVFIFGVFHETYFFFAWAHIVYILQFLVAWKVWTFLWYWIIFAFCFLLFFIFGKNKWFKFQFLVFSIWFFLCFFYFNFFLNMTVFFKTWIWAWIRDTLVIYANHRDNVCFSLLVRVEFIWDIQIFRVLNWWPW